MRVLLKMEHFSQLKEQKQAETEFMSLYLKEKLTRKENYGTVTSSGQTQSSILKF